jgi:proliferating cell nuclear antigen
MSFEMTLAQGKLFKQLIDAIKDLVGDSANFDVTAKGFSLQAMDGNHVSLVEMSIGVDAFSHFACERNMTIGLSVPTLVKVLKMVDGDDTLTLRGDTGDFVTILAESAKSGQSKAYRLKLMHIENEALCIPPISYQCVFSMPSVDFQWMVSGLLQTSSTVVIHVNPKGVTFSCKGDMTDTDIVCNDVAFTVNEECEAQEFALRYFFFFSKASPLSADVVVHMCTDNPVMIEYNISDVGHIRFFLAPKIRDDEEATTKGVKVKAEY